MEPSLNTSNFPMELSDNFFTIQNFFGAVLGQYYLTIKTENLEFKAEGYAGIKAENISFFNDKMETICTIELNTVLSANASGKYQDDITMLFKNNISVNAER